MLVANSPKPPVHVGVRWWHEGLWRGLHGNIPGVLFRCLWLTPHSRPERKRRPHPSYQGQPPSKQQLKGIYCPQCSFIQFNELMYRRSLDASIIWEASSVLVEMLVATAEVVPSISCGKELFECIRDGRDWMNRSHTYCERKKKKKKDSCIEVTCGVDNTVLVSRDGGVVF